MLIRLAQFEDIPAILDISNWAAINTPSNFALEPETLVSWVESWSETHEMYPWVVGEAETGDIIGFAKASPWKGRCAYDWSVEVTVYVHSEHHGKGIGKALYAKLFPILKAQGYHSLLGGITQPNEASVRLHESFGMKRVAMFETIGWKFNKWHDVGYWQLIMQDVNAPPQRVCPVSEVADL